MYGQFEGDSHPLQLQKTHGHRDNTAFTSAGFLHGRNRLFLHSCAQGNLSPGHPCNMAIDCQTRTSIAAEGQNLWFCRVATTRSVLVSMGFIHSTHRATWEMHGRMLGSWPLKQASEQANQLKDHQTPTDKALDFYRLIFSGWVHNWLCHLLPPTPCCLPST